METSRRNALLALVLAAWTAGNAAWTFSTSRRVAEPPPAAAHPAGEPAGAGTGTARTLALPAEAREAVLSEMRTMLGSVQGALDAAARGDTAAVRAAVLPSGMAMAADPHLEELLPADWMQMALAAHRGFDSLPGVGTDPAALAAGLGRITATCNACHSTYRLEVR
ncbi:MAG TPA: hypothetical protein VJ773_00285 [Gemmatimonadales bacterium]|nr:hypothetical protein [Gemmatimonadales bacterium]